MNSIFHILIKHIIFLKYFLILLKPILFTQHIQIKFQQIACTSQNIHKIFVPIITIILQTKQYILH